jgi:5-(aminomethyl)-3-furanmethanol phosphate kinase
MWVIKIGGSVSLTANLQSWLDWVAEHGDGRVIIVPGGGLYADAVRAFQQQRQSQGLDTLSDASAHALAIYAMDQMAMSFIDLQPNLALVKNPLEIAERSWQHRGMVWLPSEMLLKGMQISHVKALPETWDVTSDSIAAWLALVLEARQLVLVKSDPMTIGNHDLSDLIAHQVVDAHFETMLKEGVINTSVVHHSALDSIAQHFAESSQAY